MKKFFLYLTAALAVISVFHSCIKPEPEPEFPNEAVAKVSQANLIDAAAAAYAVWEDETVIPAKLSVEGEAITKAGTLELTLPQYQYALAKVLVDLKDGKTDDVIVLGYKPADHPDRDSYDKDEIAVTGGPEITEGTEDLADLAKRFIATAAEKGTIPNQTLITRKGASAIAYSTNRLTISLLRALAEYKKGKALPAKVSTDYLSAASTLKGFAQQFVGILDIWEKTIGTVSADGTHCTDNGCAWHDVHFVPIPYSGGAYADGVDQYDAKYQPYFTVVIDGITYTSAQTWGIALRGIVDLITKEGSAKMQQNRNPFEHTMGNGASLKEPIPAVTENDIWGQYPWYENTDGGPVINQTQFSPYLIARCATWFLTRQVALGKIGNYQLFTTDPDEGFVEEGISGFVSAMRMWLIAARFYKYLLDNNIEENVYDAVKDVKFDTDLYGVEMPDIELKTKKVDLDSQGTATNAKFIAKKAWTAVASEAWIHVDPASGDANDAAVVAISADPNEGEERSGSVTIKGGNVTDGLVIEVNQAKYVPPAKASLKEFAQEFVKGLDVWEATVGTVESEGYHLISKGTAWENVHYIPVGHTGGPYDEHPGNQYDESLHPAWTLNVGGETYTSAQAYEIAIKGLLNMVIAEGEEFLPTMDDRNKAYTLADNKSFGEQTMATPTDKAKWGNWPWYEQDDYYTSMTYNGKAVEEVDINFVVKACAWHLVRGTVATANNTPLGNIGNFQVFDTDSGSLTLEGYLGYISPMRELLILMRIYKYILDNNIDTKVYTAIKDQKFDYDLYGIGVPETPKPTIADFAKEFAKVADKWDNTIGTVSYTRDGKDYKFENVHYVPDNFTITLNGINYDKFQMHEMAMRALKALEAGGSFADEIAEPGSYTPASSPYHEYDDPLKETEAGFDLLSNFATRCLNYLASNGEWPNVCGYPRTTDPVLTSYNGYVCVERNLIMLARFCREIVSKNITDLGSIAKIKVSTDLWGKGSGLKISLKDFATEFVKGLNVWESTVGTVESESQHLMEKGTAWENVHFIPVGKTGGAYDDHPGNQHDAKYTPWTLNVNGTKFTSAQAWEIAVRGLLDMVLTDGQDYISKMTSRNKPGYTLGNNKAFSAITIATPSPYAVWGNYPWYEDEPLTYNGEPLAEAGVDVITKATLGHLIRGLVGIKGVFDPLEKIGNYQEFGTTDDVLILDGYKGKISPMRELILMMRLYKYLLDNNIDSNVYSAIQNIKFDYDMYHQLPKASIKDFAKEYVKILDVWEKNTGEIVMHPDVPDETVKNGHYVPSNTTITVAGEKYSTADMLETALRSYLLIRGYDGLETEKYGKNSIPALEGGAVSMSETQIPITHEYVWGSYPFNETSGNGGHLVMGTKDNNVHSQVRTDILDNWAMRSLNFQHGQTITNLCGYASGQLDGYYGCFCSQRALITYAFFFKYMLDNGLDKGTEVPDNAIIRSELFGDENVVVEDTPTLKDFAKEFVKGLDVWEATVGNVDADGTHNQKTDPPSQWENVHFIPIVGNTNSEYYNYGNNQYDPKYTPWKLNVKGTEYSSSQAWEIAIRGLLDMVTKEGNDFLAGMDDRNKAFTLQNGMAFSKAPIREPSKENKWGKHPWYEYGELVTYNDEEIEGVDVKFMVKVGAWHVVRSFIAVGSNTPLDMIGNYQEFGTKSTLLNLDGYVGKISAMRELLVLMRIYKYLLDNNINEKVYTAIKDQDFDFDLYGYVPGEVSIAIDGDMSDWRDVEGVGTSGIIKSFKMWNDDENFYFYNACEPGPRGDELWGGNGYYYYDFDLDNNPETGDYSENGNGPFEATFYITPFGGSLADKAITEHPGQTWNLQGVTTETNIYCKGVISDDLIEIEFSIPRADFATQVEAGQTISVYNWRSKGGNYTTLEYVVQ